MTREAPKVMKLTPQERAEGIESMMAKGWSRKRAEYAMDMAEGKVQGDEIPAGQRESTAA